MKKVFILLAICFVFFGCKHNKEKDYPELVALLKSKKIPNDKAEAMTKHFKDPGLTPARYNFHWEIYNAAVVLYGIENVYIMPARYGKDDETDYCTAWKFPEGDPKCKVENYSSFIIQVGTHTDYYQFATICPPPDGQCDDEDSDSN